MTAPAASKNDPRGRVLPGTFRQESLANILSGLIIGVTYFVLIFNPKYRPFLIDETLFLRAMHDHALAFFPGYIGFVWGARALTALFSPPASLQFIAAFLGAASVVVVWLWMRQMRLPLPVAVSGTLVFATNAYQLFNSSVGVTYPAEALAFAVTGFVCTQNETGRRFLYVAAALLACCGAIRQTTPLFLFPAFGYACWKRREYKPIILFSLMSLFWFVPTVLLFGGWHGIVSAGSHQTSGAVLPSTVAINPLLAAVNLTRFCIYMCYGLHLLLPFAIAGLVKNGGYRVLILPGALFYALFYVAWPGYVLGIELAMTVVAVKCLFEWKPRRAAWFLAGACLINCLQFFVLRPVIRPASTVAALFSVYASQYSEAGIRMGLQQRLKDVSPQQRSR